MKEKDNAKDKGGFGYPLLDAVSPRLVKRHFERFGIKVYECSNCLSTKIYNDNDKHVPFYCCNCGKKLDWRNCD